MFVGQSVSCFFQLPASLVTQPFEPFLGWGGTCNLSQAHKQIQTATPRFSCLDFRGCVLSLSVLGDSVAAGVRAPLPVLVDIAD